MFVLKVVLPQTGIFASNLKINYTEIDALTPNEFDSSECTEYTSSFLVLVTAGGYLEHNFTSKFGKHNMMVL